MQDAAIYAYGWGEAVRSVPLDIATVTMPEPAAPTIGRKT
jgi:hypothetical protein